MARPLPSDTVRCIAVARWTGNGQGRCRNRAWSSAGLCAAHLRFPPRPERERSHLVAFLAAADLGDEKSIRIELREKDGNEFVVLRLYVDDDRPTRRALYVTPPQLGALHAALDRALDRLDGVAR